MEFVDVSYNRLVTPATRSGSGYLIAALAVAGITLVGARWLHLNPTTIALAFLLGVLGISAYWGLREAIFMSVIATVSLDYFFLPPIGAFNIAHNPQPAIPIQRATIRNLFRSESSIIRSIIVPSPKIHARIRVLPQAGARGTMSNQFVQIPKLSSHREQFG